MKRHLTSLEIVRDAALPKISGRSHGTASYQPFLGLNLRKDDSGVSVSSACATFVS